VSGSARNPVADRACHPPACVRPYVPGSVFAIAQGGQLGKPRILKPPPVAETSVAPVTEHEDEPEPPAPSTRDVDAWQKGVDDARKAVARRERIYSSTIDVVSSDYRCRRIVSRR
jgi:hypothetical protein